MEIFDFKHLTTMVNDIRGGMYLVINTSKNYWMDQEDSYSSFEKTIECGKNYLVGDRLTVSEYMKLHRSKIIPWMSCVVKYAYDHPREELTFDVNKLNGIWSYRVRRRGEYVEIELPYHNAGGEKTWISKDGKYKYLVNVD